MTKLSKEEMKVEADLKQIIQNQSMPKLDEDFTAQLMNRVENLETKPIVQPVLSYRIIAAAITLIAAITFLVIWQGGSAMDSGTLSSLFSSQFFSEFSMETSRLLPSFSLSALLSSTMGIAITSLFFAVGVLYILSAVPTLKSHQNRMMLYNF